METVIRSYCTIKNSKASVNGSVLVEGEKNDDLVVFMSSLYKQLELNYPKFFKMDKLCKLGTLAAELLIRSIPDFETIPKNEMALVLCNNASSLDSDRTHAKAIADKNNYFPSPSVFVYTLPNIVIGEIAIKHKITGENAFFVCETFNAELMYTYSDLLLKNPNVSTVLCGWVNVDGQSAEAFVYCVKNLNFKQENELIHNSENIKHLFSL